ncbi:hypothetical protein MKW92_003595, partial [Papaver armeniacum]
MNLTRRLLLSISITCATSVSLFSFPFIASSSSSKAASITDFVELKGSRGVKSKTKFDSTYDHKDETGAPIPFTFTLGSSDNVISGITTAIKSMKVGGIHRVIIPPSQGYQNTSQEPIQPN